MMIPFEPSVEKKIKCPALRQRIFGMLLLACWAVAGNAIAANYVPNRLDDPTFTSVTNATGVMVGGTGAGTISLRSALMAADNLGGTHTVTLSTGTYTLTQALPNRQITIGNTPQNITINGNGPANTIISMTNDVNRDRILFINPTGTTNSPVVTVQGIKFQNAFLSSDVFGGAAICAGGGSAESLTVTNCVFENNILPANAYGGAAVCMQVRGNLTISNSTFTNNVSNDADGGAVLFIIFGSTLGTGYGTLSVTNSIFSGNSVNFPGAGNSNGGALAFSGQGGVTPFNATITGNTFLNNTADGHGGAISANNSAAVSTPTINFNRFVGNTSSTSATTSGLLFVNSSGSVNANNNWWGSNNGPGASGTQQASGVGTPAAGTLTANRWLQLKLSASPTTLVAAGISTLTASYLSNSSNDVIAAANLTTLVGLPITFTGGTFGSTSAAQTVQSTGTGTATFTAGATAGISTATAQVDSAPAASATITIRPTVTVSTANLPANSTTMTIAGTGFSTTPGNNSVSFSGGVTGSVTAATTTQLTIGSLTGLIAGPLNASVTTNTVSSGVQVQVATVIPVVTQNTASIGANATTLTINGFGFSSTALNNTVQFSGGATGTVSTSSSTQLNITGLSGLILGNLTAIVTSNSVSSGGAVQVATVIPVITIAISAPSLAEDGIGTLTYTFTQLGANANPLTVNFSSSGTASAVNDYTLASGTGTVTFNTGLGTGTIIIPANASTATLVMSPTDDITVEPDETVILTVTSTSNYVVGSPAAATGTINNDDTDVSVSLGATTSVSEDGAPNLVFTFTRVGVTVGVLTGNFSVGGTATLGGGTPDYTQSGAETFSSTVGTVSFGAGATQVQVTVDPSVDNIVELDENVVLTVTTGAGYNVGSPNAALGTITNDDAIISVSVSPSSVTEDGAGNLTYTFTRTGFLGSALPVDFTVSGSATKDTDYSVAGASFVGPVGTVTFALNATTATITVDPTVDSAGETNETVVVTVNAGAGYTAATAPNDSATGTILDDDRLVSVAATDNSADENTSGTGTWRITRNFTLGSTTVQLRLDAASSAGAADFTLSGATFASTAPGSTGTAIIPAGLSFVDVILTPSADIQAEAAETVILNVTADAAYTVGAPSSGTVTIEVNDFVVVNTNNSGEGSLRQALLNANAIAGADTITFEGATFTDATVPDVISLSSGQLTVNSDMTIAGLGAKVLTVQNIAAVSATSRPFRIQSGIATLQGMTISGGSCSVGGGTGGGIFNGGTLRIVGCTVSGNTTAAGGGGIANIGNLTVINSTIFNNTDNRVFFGSAGGILHFGGSAALINTTISGNRADIASTDVAGGVLADRAMTIQNCTITNNSAAAGESGIPGGVLLTSMAPVTVANSIIAFNVSNFVRPDVSGAFTSSGSNLIGNVGSATGFTAADQTGIAFSPLNPLLATLADNGGQTQTHALLPASTAINAGNNANLPVDTFDLDGDANVVEALPVDQRGVGFARAVGTVDIGAFERQKSVSIIANAASAAEGTGGGSTAFMFTLTRSGDTSIASTVDYVVSGSGATPASANDFIPSGFPSGQSSFAIGATSAVVTINVAQDAIVEDNEGFTVTLSNPTGGFVISGATASSIINNDDSATVTLTQSGGSAKSEATASRTFLATLSAAVQGGFNLAHTTTNGTATTADSDYTGNNGSLTFSGAANEVQSFIVTVTSDSKVELDETFSAALGAVSGTSAVQIAAIAVNTTALTETITNDDAAVVALSADVSQSEGAGAHVYTVTLSNPVDAPVLVIFSTSNNTATAGSDYTDTMQGVSFPANSTTAQVVSVNITNDSVVEFSELFDVALNGLFAVGRNVSLGRAAGVSTIVDNDTASVTLSGGGAVAEGNAGTTTRTFTATLNNAVQNGFTVPFTIADGSATVAGSDYSATNGSLSFAGTVNEAQTISVTINGDLVVEADETFTVTLGAVVGAPASVTVVASPQTGTIANDDASVSVSVSPSSVTEDGAGVMTYTFTRTGFLGSALPVNFTVSGTATKNTDYSVVGALFAGLDGIVFFALNAPTATITVDPTVDGSGENNETVIVTVNSGTGYTAATAPNDAATGTIFDDDTSVSVAVAPGTTAEDSGTGMVYTFTRTGDLSAALPVTFNVGGTAALTTDYLATSSAAGFTFTAGSGTITIPASDSTATLTITPVNDTLVEGSETATITVTANGYGVTGGQASGTITDDDTATLAIAATTAVTEQGGAQTITVTLTTTNGATIAPGSTVTADVVNAGGGTATSGSDFSAFGTQTVSFGPGSANNATRTVTLTTTNDNFVEGSETVNLLLQNVSAPGALGNVNSAVTISDNDRATIGYATGSSSVPEGASGAPLNLVLTISANGVGPVALARSVTVDVTTAAGGTTTGGADYTLPVLIFFSGGSGNGTVHTASLNVVDDTLVEGTETANLGLAMGFDGTNGQVTIAPGAASHTLTITDNDTASFAIDVTKTILEAGPADTVSVTLTTSAGATLASTLTMEVVDAGGGTAGTGDYTAINTIPITFNPNSANGATVTFSVSALNDSLVEGDETFNLRLQNLSSTLNGQASLGNTSSVVTIDDNDTAQISIEPTRTIPEGGGPKLITVTLNTSNGSGGTATLAPGITLTADVTDLLTGSATSVTDYDAFSATVTFTAGSGDGAVSSLSFNPINDTQIEGDESVNLSLGKLNTVLNGQASLANTDCQVTIDDRPGIFFVSTPPFGLYRQGQSLTFVVNTSEPVTVVGTPTLTMVMGTVTRNVPYVSGTGTSMLSFTYVIVDGDVDDDGVEIFSPLVAGTATLRDPVGNDMVLTFFTSGEGNFAIVDGIVPSITISAPSVTTTKVGPVSYVVSYADNKPLSISLSTSNITLNSTGTANATLAVDPGATANERIVTLSNITGAGTLGISIAAGTAMDPAGNTAPAAGPSATFLVDTPPVATVSFNPAAPRTNDKLIANVVGTDAENDPLTYTYVWKVNGTVVRTTTATALASDTLDLSLAGNGNKGDVVTVDVTPNDGTVNGNVATATVTIVNALPVAVVAVSPADPRTNATLTATVTTSDADGDPVTLTYVWKVVSAVKKTTAATALLSDTYDLSISGNGDSGDVVTLEVTPNDGAPGATVIANILVGPPVFLSGPSVIPAQPIAVLEAQFSTVLDQTNLTVTWDFGDGSPNATGLTPVHTYALPGIYTVTVTAVNPLTGSSATKTLEVNVLELDGSTLTSLPGTQSMRVTTGTILLSQNKNKVTLNWIIHFAANDQIGGQGLEVALNGASRKFIMDNRGNAKLADGVLHVRIKRINGAVVAQEAKASAVMTGPNIATDILKGVTLDANGLPKVAIVRVNFANVKLSYISPLTFKVTSNAKMSRFGFNVRK